MFNRKTFLSYTFRAVVLILCLVPGALLLQDARRYRSAALVKSYEVLSLSPSDSPERSHTTAYIASTAGTFDERAYTVRRAAIQLQSMTKSSVVSVYLGPSAALVKQGLAVAVADYAPDGRGFSDGAWTWKIEASEARLDPGAITVASAWYEDVAKFKEEDQATASVSRQFRISPRQVLQTVIAVSNTAMNRKPYPLEQFAGL